MSICTGLVGHETIWIEDLFITPDLSSLTINATTCGEFTEMYAYVGNGFLNDESINISSLIINTPILDQFGNPSGRSTMKLTIPASTFNLTDLNTTIVIRLVNDANLNVGEDAYETTKAVASYAGIYPCLIHNIKHSSNGCNDCKSMNNAIMLNLMMDITSAYMKFDRISEAISTYNDMLNICLENEIIFKGNKPGSPSISCGQYGGIGCWIIDTTFVVGQPYIM